MARQEVEGIYNWAKHEGSPSPIRTPRADLEIDDETLRDGLQGIQLEQHPTTESKRIYLLNAAPFINHADIGFPGPQESRKKEVADLINLVIGNNLKITLSAAGVAARPVEEAINPIIDLSHQFDGYPLEADLFWDASSYRSDVEKWDRAEMMQRIKLNIQLLKNHNLPVMFVPERATDTSPAELAEVLTMAADLGVDRICIADSRGIANERATRNILRWSFEEIGSKYPDIKWDLHQHNDKNLGVSNCLIAAEEGIDRVHATAFCIGERAGNVDLLILTLNLNEEGYRNDRNLVNVDRFAHLASDVLNYPIPANTPVYGDDAFASGSGIHASAIGKEQQLGRDYLLYFPFNPETVGRKPRIEVGRMSGRSNVQFKLRELGILETPELVADILDAAQEGTGYLSNTTIRGIAQRHQGPISK